jgi:tetratricopeptide (TPR) repeat protein
MPISLNTIRDIDRSFAAKQYDRAAELLQAVIADNPAESSLRLKLADAWSLQGKNAQAIELLRRIAIEFARDGFITKAIAVQKRIERIDPAAATELFRSLEENANQEPAAPAAATVQAQVNASAEPAPRVDARHRALDRLFEGLSREELAQIIARLNERSLGEKQIVFREGDADTGVFIVVEGEVQILIDHHGKEVELARLGEGDFFGEVALLTGKPRTATVKCTRDTTFLVLERPEFLSLSERYPVLQESLVAALERRAQSAIERLLEIDRSS